MHSARNCGNSFRKMREFWPRSAPCVAIVGCDANTYLRASLLAADLLAQARKNFPVAGELLPNQPGNLEDAANGV